MEESRIVWKAMRLLCIWGNMHFMNKIVMLFWNIRLTIRNVYDSIKRMEIYGSALWNQRIF